jgi:hypothetical protein
MVIYLKLAPESTYIPNSDIIEAITPYIVNLSNLKILAIKGIITTLNAVKKAASLDEIVYKLCVWKKKLKPSSEPKTAATFSMYSLSINFDLSIKGKNKKQEKDNLSITNKPGEIYVRDIFIRGKVTPQNIVIIKSAIIDFLLISIRFIVE